VSICASSPGSSLIRDFGRSSIRPTSSRMSSCGRRARATNFEVRPWRKSWRGCERFSPPSWRAARDLGRQKSDIAREQSLELSLEQSSKRLESFLADGQSSPTSSPQSDSSLPADGQSSPSAKAERSEQVMLLAIALASLPERQRQAVELHYLHGLTPAAIAEILGIDHAPKSLVMPLQARARRALPGA
jgi:RNA polymerase sigma factor (sigma-70 family)